MATIPCPHYEFRVRGRMTDSLLPAFDGFAARVEPGDTVLSGVVRDQADLHGVLAQIGASGLELVAVRRVCDADDEGTVDDPA
jgi:hypothetical protein